ncbi:MAG: hypothetical protein Tsb0019_29650 [Roseibium sp.]
MQTTSTKQAQKARRTGTIGRSGCKADLVTSEASQGSHSLNDLPCAGGLAKANRSWHKPAIIKRRAGALANLPTGQGGFRNRDAAG